MRNVSTIEASVLDVHDGADQMSMWMCQFPVGERGGWGRHHHREHQLAWVSEGSSTVHVGSRTWVVSPTRAVWIPGGTPHDIVNRSDALLWCYYIWPEHCPVAWPTPVELAITPLARELLLGLGDPDVLAPGRTSEVSLAAATVLFAQLAKAATASPSLPLPVDPRACELAEALLAHPADQDTLEVWARRLATSASTLRRAFRTETGLTFTEWRTRVRLDAALVLLAGELSVERVAHRVGYASTSGFVDAFRRRFGRAPATYRRATGLAIERAAG